MFPGTNTMTLSAETLQQMASERARLLLGEGVRIVSVSLAASAATVYFTSDPQPEHPGPIGMVEPLPLASDTLPGPY